MAEGKKERLRIRATPWKKTLAEQTLDMLGEPPAYIKRARRTERTIEALFARAEKKYDLLQRFVRLRGREWEEALGSERKRLRLKVRLDETIERCNARWIKWVEADGRYDEVNAEIDGYNRYYVQERQAALRYVPLWAAHVEPKARIGKDDLLARYCLIST